MLYNLLDKTCQELVEPHAALIISQQQNEKDDSYIFPIFLFLPPSKFMF